MPVKPGPQPASRYPRHGVTASQARQAQRGLSLLESLVALLVLAVAVISLLAVQMRTLADARTGTYRAQAVGLIEDLGERLKSNPEGFAQLSAFVGNSSAPGGGESSDCKTRHCTPQQLAQWDLAEWRDKVQSQLPNGQAHTFLSPDEASGVQRQLGVMVVWRSNEYSDDSDYLNFFQLSDLPSGADCPSAHLCHLVYVQP